MEKIITINGIDYIELNIVKSWVHEMKSDLEDTREEIENE